MKQRNADKKLAARITGYEQAMKDKGGSALHDMRKPGSRKRD